MAKNMFNGPIPGENYTSDTKNYPWHRPPQYVNLDDAIEASAKRLMSEEHADGFVTALQQGMDIATLTDLFVTSGIGGGKWTPDMALLIAGPVSHILFLMAKGAGIENPELGIDLPKNTRTKSYFDTISMDKQKVEVIKEAISDMAPELEQKVTGFMGMAQEQPQEAPPVEAQPPIPQETTNGVM